MRPIFITSAVAVLFVVVPSPCFALWGIVRVSKEQAKELGMELRPAQAGTTHVRVELEFKIEGALKNFSGVDLQIGQATSRQ